MACSSSSFDDVVRASVSAACRTACSGEGGDGGTKLGATAAMTREVNETEYKAVDVKLKFVVTKSSEVALTSTAKVGEQSRHGHVGQLVLR